MSLISSGMPTPEEPSLSQPTEAKPLTPSDKVAQQFIQALPDTTQGYVEASRLLTADIKLLTEQIEQSQSASLASDTQQAGGPQPDLVETAERAKQLAGAALPSTPKDQLEEKLMQYEALCKQWASRIDKSLTALEGSGKEPAYDPMDMVLLEEAIRNVRDLTKDKAIKDRYQATYDQTMIPLVARARPLLGRRLKAVSRAAAGKGSAAQAAWNLLIEPQKHSIMRAAGTSQQAVFLRPDAGAVIKSSSERAADEERVMGSMFDILSPGAVVPAFNLLDTDHTRLGMPAPPPAVLDRAYELSTFPVTSLLRAEQRAIQILEKEIAQLKKASEQKLDKQVAERLQEEGSGLNNGAKGQLEKKIRKQLKAEGKSVREDSIYIYPYYSQEWKERGYERCQRCRWQVKGVDYNFKEVMLLFAKGAIDEKSIVCLPPDGEFAPDTHLIQDLLKPEWRVTSSAGIVGIIPSFGITIQEEVKKLKDVQAKPFIEGMRLMSKIGMQLQDAILDRLTPEAQLNALLTAELQFMDLHSDNLGVQPEPNLEYAKLCNNDIQFINSAGSNERGFLTLMDDYLLGRVPPSAPIGYQGEGIWDDIKKLPSNTDLTYQYEGKIIAETLQEALSRGLPGTVQMQYIVNATLGECAELQKALDVRWKLVLFDTDISVGESNRAIKYSIEEGGQSVERTMVPVRSALLKTNWKDKPLTDEVLQLLMTTDEKDAELDSWMNRHDAPIYARLSKNAKDRLASAPFRKVFERYTFKELRKKGGYVQTIADLQKAFTGDIIYNSSFWAFIGQELSPAEDLTGKTSRVMKRREQIAKQFFPRISVAQQQALLERQSQRRAYINSYKAFEQTTSEGRILANEIGRYIEDKVNPLRKEESKQFLMELRALGAMPDTARVRELHQKVLKRCCPTYFNLMQVMYPLLGDAYRLTELIITKGLSFPAATRLRISHPGAAIGDRRLSLEKLMEAGMGAPDSETEIKELTYRLEAKLAAEQSPARHS